jgi:hypothetical protein
MTPKINQTTIPSIYATINDPSDVTEYALKAQEKIYSTVTKISQTTPFYKIKKSISIDVVQNAYRMALQLKDESVHKQTIKLFDDIDTHLDNAMCVSKISNRLPQIHLTEQEDNSALIEWNFENFRIGFLIESQPKKSFYFIVHEDNTIGAYRSETRCLNNAYNEILSNIVNFVLKHS